MSQNEKKSLNTKKMILDYIDEVKKYEKEGADEAQMEGYYKEIDAAIEGMRAIVKTNTILYLQTELNKKLGKYEPLEKQLEVNHFIEFFKLAYPDGKRRKDFTWVLTDANKITVDQILHTLKYINAYCLKERLSKPEKEDIYPMLERVAKTDSLKHINQVRSLEGLRRALRVKIASTPEGHKIVRI